MGKEVCSVVLQRWEIINCLRQEGKDKRTLVEDLDCSRSTVNRAIRELESMRLVEYVDGKYVVTPLGETVANGFEEMMQTVELRLQLEPFLRWMPEDAFDLELDLLHDADILLPKESDPNAMINKHIYRLKRADQYQLLLPRTGLHAHETAHENIMNNGAHGELVVTPQIAETYRSDPAYAPLTDDMVEAGRLSIFVYEEKIPYFIGIIDRIVQIGCVDENNRRHAIVETGNDAVRDWAENKFEDFKRQAKPFAITPKFV